MHRYILLALTLALSNAVQIASEDADPYFNNPTWNEKFPAAAASQIASEDAPPAFNRAERPGW